MTIYMEVTQEIAKGNLTEGFYERRDSKGICYLLQINDDWYMQCRGGGSFLITKTSPEMFITEADPYEVLKFLDDERQFVESRLKVLAEQNPFADEDKDFEGETQ